MERFLERLEEGEVLVADGAIGTLLLAKGLQPGECPECVNLTDPELLEDIARRYLEAGAEIVQTNTFGASPVKLSLYHLDHKAETINRKAISSNSSLRPAKPSVTGPMCPPLAGRVASC